MNISTMHLAPTLVLFLVGCAIEPMSTSGVWREDASESFVEWMDEDARVIQDGGVEDIGDASMGDVTDAAVVYSRTTTPAEYAKHCWGFVCCPECYNYCSDHDCGSSPRVPMVSATGQCVIQEPDVGQCDDSDAGV